MQPHEHWCGIGEGISIHVPNTQELTRTQHNYMLIQTPTQLLLILIPLMVGFHLFFVCLIFSCNFSVFLYYFKFSPSILHLCPLSGISSSSLCFENGSFLHYLRHTSASVSSASFPLSSLAFHFLTFSSSISIAHVRFSVFCFYIFSLFLGTFCVFCFYFVYIQNVASVALLYLIEIGSLFDF